MHRNTNGTCLIGNRTCNCLTNPPGSIRTEFVSFTIIKFLHCFDQAKISFLNEVKEQHSPSDISLGNAYNQTKIRLCKTFLCLFITLFHTFCQFNFFICCQKTYFTDLFQVHTNRIFNADTFRHRQIDLIQFNFFLIIHFFDVCIVIQNQLFIIS